MDQQILKTKDYSKFGEHTSNREVDKRHVAALARAISVRNLLHINPIVVDENFKVIDGQHRLAAARRLGVAIYYVIDGRVKKQDIASLNSNQKNWKPVDYVNYWTVEKAPGFDLLSIFLSKFSFFSVSTALSLIGDNDRDAYKKGRVVTDNIKQAHEVAMLVQWFAEQWDFCKQRNFALAILHIHKSGKLEVEKLKERVKAQPRSMVPCINTQQYVDMLQEIYNYRIHNKVKF